MTGHAAPGPVAAAAGRPPVGAPRGLVLLAHGARDPAWAEPFRRVAARVRASRPGVAVELAFLEFMSPGLTDAGAALAAAGCRAIDVVPLFLGGGGHVRRDVPAQLDALRAAHPACAFRLHAAAGETDRVIEALAGAAIDFCDAEEAPGDSADSADSADSTTSAASAAPGHPDPTERPAR